MLWWILAGCVVPSEEDDTSDSVDGTDCAKIGFEPGDCAPDFTLPDANGIQVSLSDFRGTPVAVVGSSQWCTRCQGLVQELSDWYTADAPEGIEILNVLVQDIDNQPASVENAAEWRDTFALPFRVLADTEAGWVAAWGDGSGTDFEQHSYTVVDSNGEVTWQAKGNPSNVAGDIAFQLENAD